ncbi:hypothetical protein IAR55_004173 [Kwoniella newhampshirensis]|uniref:N-acetyltransferase domain-containing protein n=1 Tax=Kwoniella newhampshirensis TaxID=1651941 RepID=A0AAW0YZ31_9TREE
MEETIASADAKFGEREGLSKNASASVEDMAEKAGIVIEKVSKDELPSYASRLAAIVSHHMSLGMSTYFTHPYTLSSALRIFTSLSNVIIDPDPTTCPPSFPPPLGGVILFVAKLVDRASALDSIDMEGNPTRHPEVVGSVQLAFASMPNGAFRSEVRKMLVDVRYGGRGIGKILLRTLEDEARKWGSTVCMLDTEQHSFGERLYRSCGWTELGVLPRFHWPPDKSEKRNTVYFYKHLDEGDGAEETKKTNGDGNGKTITETSS